VTESAARAARYESRGAGRRSNTGQQLIVVSVPRYDIPKAAPEPLRTVQLFVNTIDLSHDREWLSGWLEEEGVRPTDATLRRAREVREAIRELLIANNHQPVDGDPYPLLRRAAKTARFTLDLRQPELVPQAPGVEGALGRVLAIAFTAMLDGTWPRLKVCRNHGCRWAFYDHSRNRSASWCSMQLCGNRKKTRAYRRRHANA
jgi:predicted RNA-binding Zn ribbon-like protein